MNAIEAGFLLLSSHLGNPDRKVLTTAQLRMLADRMRYMVGICLSISASLIRIR